MAGAGEGRDGLEAAIEHCELALASLDAAGLFADGASLSLALDNLRRRRDEIITPAADKLPPASAGGER